MSDAIPADFNIPEELEPAVRAVFARYSFLGDTIADELMAAGLPWDQASVVATDYLVRQACDVAMTLALAEDREPKLERWQEVTARTFLDVAHTWAEALTQPDIAAAWRTSLTEQDGPK